MKRIQFTIKDYLENPERRVETRNGVEAEIFLNRQQDDYVAYIDGEGYMDYYDNGKRSTWGVNNDSEYDLFIVTEERKYNTGDNFTYKGQGFKVKGLSDWGYKVEALKPYTTNDAEVLYTVEIGFAVEKEMTEYQPPCLTPMEKAVYDLYDRIAVFEPRYKEIAKELTEIAEKEFEKKLMESLKSNEGLYDFMYKKGLEDGKKEAGHEYGRGYVNGYKDCKEDFERMPDGK